MRTVCSATLIMLLAACTWIPSDATDPQVAVMVVNGSIESVHWVIEQPNGVVDRLPVQACSASSNAIQVGRAWHLEVDGEIAVASEMVRILDAPITTLRVDISPQGEVEVTGPGASDRMPDVPIRFACAAG